MIDTIITGIDSHIFYEAQYTGGNELFLITSKGNFIVMDVSDKEFEILYKNPTHEAFLKLLQNHSYSQA